MISPIETEFDRRDLQPLSGELGQWLRQRGWTLAVAESVTVGYIQTLVASVSGASDYFAGGVVAYRAEQKIQILGVKSEDALRNQSVSPNVAEQMARGVLNLFQTQISLATTGFAEPAPEFGAPQPMAYLAIASLLDATQTDPTVVIQRLQVQGDRRTAQKRLAAEALMRLSEYLLRASGS